VARVAVERGPLFGIALKIAATLSFGTMGLLVKLLGGEFHAGQIIFFRAFFALIPVFALLWWQGGGLATLATRHPSAHALRSGAGTLAMLFGFSALLLLPLADATAIGFAAPVISVILAVFILGEAVRFYRWAAVAAGFLGVLMMVWPHLGGGASSSGWGVAFALAGAVCSAFAMNFIRLMSRPGEGHEPGTTIAFYFQATAATVGALFLPFVWVTPSWGDLGLLILIGICGGMGQLLMTHSYAYAPVATIATFDYVAMIWAVMFGYLFLSEFPAAVVLLGSGVVAASGIFIVWRERQIGKDKARISSS
jgi:drug/metabolite transporter (DMT)-like permease